MNKNKNLPYLEKEKEFILHTYNRIPLEISYGDGVYLFTKDGKRYLDFFSGLGVNALGYNHPSVVKAIQEQVSKYVHLSNYYVSESQVQLAELLVKLSRMSGVFFTNSGAEATEAAIKLIRKVSGPDKMIISFSNAFHGRTYGALSVTAKSNYKQPFEPLLSNIYQIEFNNIDSLISNISENTAAVFLEFIQGEGGINLVSNNFVKQLFELKNKFSFTLVADEIQSGLGRTGRPFAFNHYNVLPDIVLIAKALGGGLPLGAILTNKYFSSILQPGEHGTTFGGNPVACAAGVAVLNEIFENSLLQQVENLGEYFMNEIRLFKQKFPEIIKEVRGKGFMIGIEMNSECSGIVKSLREKNVLINSTNTNVLRILPPLISEKEHIDFFLYNFEEILRSH